jgi:hypothetical protein
MEASSKFHALVVLHLGKSAHKQFGRKWNNPRISLSVVAETKICPTGESNSSSFLQLSDLTTPLLIKLQSSILQLSDLSHHC